MVYICSPRYFSRYSIVGERIRTEVRQFMERKRDFGLPFAIPVLFGVDIYCLKYRGIPSLISDFYIQSRFVDKNSLQFIKEENIEDEINKEAQRIAIKIQERFVEMNKLYFTKYPWSCSMLNLGLISAPK